MEIHNPFNDNTGHINVRYITHNRFIVLFPLLSLLLFGLAGCVTFNDPEASQEYISDAIGTIDPQTRLGQTFISRRPKLNGITIWLTPLADKTSTLERTIVAELYSSPDQPLPIFSTIISLPASGTKLAIPIQLPVQNNLPGQSYYLLLRSDSTSIQINGRNEDAYQHGQAYINQMPVNADFAFRLTYRYDFSSLLQDLYDLIPSLWLVIPLLIVLWLPGRLLLSFSGLPKYFDFGERTALSIGISIAIIPLVMLWTTMVDFHWNSTAVFVVAILLILLSIIKLIFIDKNVLLSTGNVEQIRSRISSLGASQHFPVTMCLLLIIFVVTLALRLIMVRDLATPAWVDSVHHALITRLIMAQGVYPTSYLPYWNITPTAYHPGFHSIAAFFTWLSGLDLSRALMVLGQVINGLVIFSVYSFAKMITHRTSIGLLAATITGFLTPMPAYYTSWGRFTELTGLLILPVVLGLIILMKRENLRSVTRWSIILGAISSAGLFMIHYRVAVFLGLLIISYLLINLFLNRNSPGMNRGYFLLNLLCMAVVALVLVSPWLFQLLNHTVIPILRLPVEKHSPFFQDFPWGFLTTALGKQTLVFACLGLIWGLINRRGFVYVLLVWVFSLFFVANINAMNLPGGGLVTNLSVEIMLFIPISVFGGYLIDQIITHWKVLIPGKWHTVFSGIFVIVIGLVAFIGAKQLVTIINPITVLSRDADLPAIEWVSKNIPEEETILINPFAWGYGNFAGSDGGYWISPLSGRRTFTPPVLYGLGADRNAINEQNQKLINISTDPSAVKDLLISNQLQYIFIGAKGGVLSPDKLINSGLFDLLYQEDGVWIFQLIP